MLKKVLGAGLILGVGLLAGALLVSPSFTPSSEAAHSVFNQGGYSQQNGGWRDFYADRIGTYAYDRSSFEASGSFRSLLYKLNVRVTLTDPNLIAQKNQQYASQLQNGDSVAYTEELFAFYEKRDPETYAVLRTRVYSRNGVLLASEETTVDQAHFSPVPDDTAIEEALDIAEDIYEGKR